MYESVRRLFCTRVSDPSMSGFGAASRTNDTAQGASTEVCGRVELYALGRRAPPFHLGCCHCALFGAGSSIMLLF